MTAAPVPDAAVSASAPRRADLGRVAVVTLFALTALSNGAGLVHRLRDGEGGWSGAAQVTGSVLALTFCAFVVRAYLRRGAASATDRGVLVWVAAPLATALPLALAAVPPAATHGLVTLAELLLTLAGLAFSVWAVRSLATNLSVVPQARAVVEHGPYRWIRHPLYTGELVAMLGLALRVGRAWVVAVVVLQVLLQVYRARREEALLRRQLDGYDAYSRRTSALVPGVW